jgi:hypothetical protein
MNTYTFITIEGRLIFIDADSYEEACALYHEQTAED